MYLFNVLLFSILLLNVGAKDHASAHDSHKVSEFSIKIDECICSTKLGPYLNRKHKSFSCKPDETINSLSPDLQQSIKAKCQSMTFKNIKRMFFDTLLFKQNGNKNIEKNYENNTRNGKNTSNSQEIKNDGKNSTGNREPRIEPPSNLNENKTIEPANINNTDNKHAPSLVPSNVNKTDGNNTTNGKNTSNSQGINNDCKNSTGTREPRIESTSNLNENKTIEPANINNTDNKHAPSLVPNVKKTNGNNTTNGKNTSNSQGIKNDDKNSTGTREPRIEPPSNLNKNKTIEPANINNTDNKHAPSLVPNVNKTNGSNTTNGKNTSNSQGINNDGKNSTGTREPRIELPSSSNLKPKDSIKDKSHVNRTDTTQTEVSSLLENPVNSEAFKYESSPTFYKKNKTILIDVSVLEKIAQLAEHICDCSTKPILKDIDNVSCTAASPFTTLGSSMMGDIDALCEYLNEMIALLNLEKNKASEGNEDFSSDMDSSGIRERMVEHSGGANNLNVPQIEATAAPGANNFSVSQPTTTVAPSANNHSASQPTTTAAPGAKNHSVSQPTTTVAPGANNHSASQPTTTAAPGANNHSASQPTTTVAPGANNHSVSQPTTTAAPEPLSNGTETSGRGPLAKEPEKYSMATILGLGICGFACGILLAIAITMTYMRYRRRVYVTYRP